MIRPVAKSFLRKLYTITFYWVRNTAIVCYHSFANDENLLIKGQGVNTKPSTFEDYCIFFKKYYNPISLHELVKKFENDEPLYRNIVITCDDGFKSAFTNGKKIAQKYNIPITIFVNTAFIGNRRILWRSLIRYFINIGESSVLAKRIAEYYEDSFLANQLNDHVLAEWTLRNYRQPCMELAIASALRDLKTGVR
jgi:peptidoglycan/xylan/chitin deacetylase (PgdA/CDA1 family)